MWAKNASESLNASLLFSGLQAFLSSFLDLLHRGDIHMDDDLEWMDSLERGDGAPFDPRS